MLVINETNLILFHLMWIVFIRHKWSSCRREDNESAPPQLVAIYYLICRNCRILCSHEMKEQNGDQKHGGKNVSENWSKLTFCSWPSRSVCCCSTPAPSTRTNSTFVVKVTPPCRWWTIVQHGHTRVTNTTLFFSAGLWQKLLVWWKTQAWNGLSQRE